MERATFNVLFFIKRAKRLKNGNVPISARITVNGERAEFGIQKSVDDEQWCSQKGGVLGFSKDAKKLNAYLDLIKRKLYQFRQDLEESGRVLTAELVRNAYLGIEENAKTILGTFSDHNQRCRKLVGIDFAIGTCERYETCYRHLANFIQHTYDKSDVFLRDINPTFVKDFEFYLKTERKCAHNSATKYLKNFKKITRIANSNGWMKKDPFVNTKFHLEDVDMDFLSTDELELLMSKHLSVPRLQLVKDIYLFCCFTGLAFIDVSNLVYSDLKERDGKTWIVKKRQKTKNWCNIPMLDPAVQIMEKYKSHPVCLSTGKVLPVLSNQKMNAYLKEIADLCGIEKNLSTHTARHTFATTVTLSNQISIEVVSKMLGHSSINMTKKYARVVDDLINKDMTKIYGKYEQVEIL